MSVADIILERETANDESALIVGVFVASGTEVALDELLFETENSKATQEVRATQAGVLTHSLAVGHTVEFGVPIARIGPAREPAASPPALAALPAVAAAMNGSNGHQKNAPPLSRVDTLAPPLSSYLPGRILADPRVSNAARALLVEHGLTPADFDLDFITSDDVRRRLGLPGSYAQARRQEIPVDVPGVLAPPFSTSTVQSAEGRKLSPRKRAEIDSLSSGAGNTMLSVLGTSLGDLPITRGAGDFLSGRITDLVIYEASRLMRKFPRLNSHYSDGFVVHRDVVHAGLAIDSGERLVVYGIENADEISLPALSEVMTEAIGRYLENQLTTTEMTRATFTVTDLSGDELDFVLPLLPRGQCVILGITRSGQMGFRIFAGFDHRVTEGREVAIFLGELRERLLSFAAAQTSKAVAANCVYCDRSAADAIAKGKEKGLLKVTGADGHEVLCCASCWNGW